MAADLTVVGLGYVGLPLASEAVRSGLSVLGIDVSQAVVAGLNAGVSHVDDLTDSDIRAMRAAGFRASTDNGDLDRADTVIVCVPSPLTEERGSFDTPFLVRDVEDTYPWIGAEFAPSKI